MAEHIKGVCVRGGGGGGLRERAMRGGWSVKEGARERGPPGEEIWAWAVAVTAVTAVSGWAPELRQEKAVDLVD